MTRSVAIIAALVLGTSAAFADSKPSDEEAKKLAEALAALGCEGGELEKETEGSGTFEVDDAKCKFGGQWDIKFDSKYQATSMTRD
ncbi:MAG: hypothetical protein RIC14_09530 [Filomicrobium sp.]